MRFPSKVTTYKNSSVALFPVILAHLQKEPMAPSKLYQKIKGRVAGLDEYMEILDCLYALKKIELEGGKLRYVD